MTRTEATQTLIDCAAERKMYATCLAASKRYKGRAADQRRFDALGVRMDEAQAVIDAHNAEARRRHEADAEARRREAEQAECDAWEAEDIAATNAADAARSEAFRERVATRAYYMALNGQGRDDADRWLYAEQLQRAAEAKPVPFTRHAGRDYYDENAYRH